MNSIFIGTRIEALQKVEELTSVIEIITVKDSFVHKARANSKLVNKDRIPFTHKEGFKVMGENERTRSILGRLISVNLYKK